MWVVRGQPQPSMRMWRVLSRVGGCMGGGGLAPAVDAHSAVLSVEGRVCRRWCGVSPSRRCAWRGSFRWEGRCVGRPWVSPSRRCAWRGSFLRGTEECVIRVSPSRRCACGGSFQSEGGCVGGGAGQPQPSMRMWQLLPWALDGWTASAIGPAAGPAPPASRAGAGRCEVGPGGPPRASLCDETNSESDRRCHWVMAPLSRCRLSEAIDYEMSVRSHEMCQMPQIVQYRMIS